MCISIETIKWYAQYSVQSLIQYKFTSMKPGDAIVIHGQDTEKENPDTALLSWHEVPFLFKLYLSIRAISKNL